MPSPIVFFDIAGPDDVALKPSELPQGPARLRAMKRYLAGAEDLLAAAPPLSSSPESLVKLMDVVDDTTVTSHIKRIRKKFRAVDDEFDCIETVYGMGYRWVAD